ncbi:MAG: hydrolase [Gammaproteobacteria bacterium]|nr:hydrolase [Gammaproteobacteria bacterium]
MITKSRFIPAPWCRGAHAQTLLPRIISPRFPLDLLDERLELPDGDFVDLCWTNTPEDGDPVIAIFHGLEGSVHSPYANGILHAIGQRGWCGVFMHFRGCSGVHNRLNRSYHSGETGDIRFLIKTLSRRLPRSPLFTIGYSLGGNALLKYLGESGSGSGVTAAVTVSVPFLLNRGADRLDSGFSRFYQWYLIRSLHRKMQAKYNGREAPVNMDDLKSYRNFWTFDHHITAPVHGFASAEDYYRRSSSRQFLKSIQSPTLLIQSKDDPFLPQDALPAATELSESILLELSEHGGHVGFIAGNNPLRPRFWLLQRIPDFIAENIRPR